MNESCFGANYNGSLWERQLHVSALNFRVNNTSYCTPHAHAHLPYAHACNSDLLFGPVNGARVGI